MWSEKDHPDQHSLWWSLRPLRRRNRLGVNIPPPRMDAGAGDPAGSRAGRAREPGLALGVKNCIKLRAFSDPQPTTSPKIVFAVPLALADCRLREILERLSRWRFRLANESLAANGRSRFMLRMRLSLDCGCAGFATQGGSDHLFTVESPAAVKRLSIRPISTAIQVR
jgi:hypothetical protein